MTINQIRFFKKEGTSYDYRQNIKITFETFKLIYCIVFRMIVAYILLNIIMVLQCLKIEKIRNQSDLYCERKGEMEISNSNWKILVYVNLTETMIKNQELYLIINY